MKEYRGLSGHKAPRLWIKRTHWRRRWLWRRTRGIGHARWCLTLLMSCLRPDLLSDVRSFEGTYLVADLYRRIVWPCQHCECKLCVTSNGTTPTSSNIETANIIQLPRVTKSCWWLVVFVRMYRMIQLFLGAFMLYRRLIANCNKSMWAQRL